MHTDTQKLTIRNKRVVMVIPRRIAVIRSQKVGSSREYTVTRVDTIDPTIIRAAQIRAKSGKMQKLQEMTELKQKVKALNCIIRIIDSKGTQETSMTKVNQYLGLRYHINKAVKIDNV